MMQQQQILKQQQALIQQQQQQPLYPHPSLLAPPQIEPIPSGNLPPGSDASSCRSMYVGNVHTQMTDALLQEVFQSTGPIEGCKLIRKEKATLMYLLVILARKSQMPLCLLALQFTPAALIQELCGIKKLYDQEVMGLSLSGIRSCPSMSRSAPLLRKWLGSRQICCNWATKGARSNEDEQRSDRKKVTEIANVSTEDRQENARGGRPENNPEYTTVYAGNLSSGLRTISIGEEVRVRRDKGFGFVRYSNHSEAAPAIQIGNARILYGKSINVYPYLTVHQGYV